MLDNSSLDVVVRNKGTILFNGKVQAISSVNDKGPFDVLGKHENFIALIKEKITIRIKDKETKEIKIENGIIRVCDNKVFIYANFQL